MNQTTLTYVSRTLLVRCLSNLHQATTPSVQQGGDMGFLLHVEQPLHLVGHMSWCRLLLGLIPITTHFRHEYLHMGVAS
jgi:hypothetical protein